MDLPCFHGIPDEDDIVAFILQRIYFLENDKLAGLNILLEEHFCDANITTNMMKSELLQ